MARISPRWGRCWPNLAHAPISCGGIALQAMIDQDGVCLRWWRRPFERKRNRTRDARGSITAYGPEPGRSEHPANGRSGLRDGRPDGGALGAVRSPATYSEMQGSMGVDDTDLDDHSGDDFVEELEFERFTRRCGQSASRELRSRKRESSFDSEPLAPHMFRGGRSYAPVLAVRASASAVGTVAESRKRPRGTATLARPRGEDGGARRRFVRLGSGATPPRRDMRRSRSMVGQQALPRWGQVRRDVEVSSSVAGASDRSLVSCVAPDR